MISLHPGVYNELYNWTTIPLEIHIADHLNGFDSILTNPLLNYISAADQDTTITTYYIFNEQVKKNYSNLKFKLSRNQTDIVFQSLKNYNYHPPCNYKNFICSFNGSPHVSRKLLVSILEKFGYFDSRYCSKNFAYTTDVLDGHIHDYVPDRSALYRKFFIADNSEDFFNSINSFGYDRYNHKQNIYNLENRLTESFIHVVSETMATSYHPFMSEKSFYSIVTQGLFVSYAQPGWHDHFEKHFGFKKYTKLFDYRFDTIQNPVKRLVELITMISKFSHLTTAE